MNANLSKKKRRTINHKNWWQSTRSGRPTFEFTADELAKTIQELNASANLRLNLVRCDGGPDRWYLSLGKQNALTKGAKISPILHAFELRAWLDAFTAGFWHGVNAGRQRNPMAPTF